MRPNPGQECLEGKRGTEDLVSRPYPLCSHHIEVARHLNRDKGVGKGGKEVCAISGAMPLNAGCFSGTVTAGGFSDPVTAAGFSDPVTAGRFSGSCALSLLR